MASTATSPSAGGRSRAMTPTDDRGVIDKATDTAQEVDDQATLAFEFGADSAEELARDAGLSNAYMMQTVRVLGGAMIGIAVLVVVLSEVFTLDVISNSTGPFSSVIDSLETTGGAALGLLVIGLLVLAANRVMGFFGGGGF